jgi:hypothetical protein
MGIITSHKKFQECFGKYATLLKDIKAGNLDTTFYMYLNDNSAKNNKKNNKKVIKF